jgi:hypothetical protein
MLLNIDMTYIRNIIVTILINCYAVCVVFYNRGLKLKIKFYKKKWRFKKTKQSSPIYLPHNVQDPPL